MQIIPAIDIRHGKCVRLLRGDFDQETVFSDTPVDVAKRWQEAGAEMLHLVDLDGALAGHPVNAEVIRSIVGAIDIPVELGGGIRTMRDIDSVLSMGVHRVILGSAAVKDQALVQTACDAYGDRIVVGIDAKDNVVAVDGWGVSGNIEAVPLAKKMKDAGVTTIIYTDISRDGTLEGINVEATASLAEESGLSVIASGGAKSMDDITDLIRASNRGITGVVLGKSLYTGAIDLKQAIALSKEAR
ncbi:1-(5-phosphoribosyl)-5-[(5-phosphoribosylamino) me thylideneamino]imidazole-4-carboxamide isomerase [Selenomonas sp. TAMA-11512]|uniref:1-(5-phosphoribosyl)-5-[(5- phosphoribosylamino)methylideneamino]imidazole-4- carboxamide isomerase n=1 Tax=Selenomonas sp. TAMA-11512 TaxID=3095337 RepID=UPI003089043C|nr:1-(5-phosphoribosyl)-5-[(5-phosphoribosylamino) me thylideneamino]imidazole-4-carboxamide isomerase [Selenomonas sp. TAMA-11512]